MPTIGDKIRVMRKSRDWDQQDLAKRIGVKRNAVSMWENGKRTPGRDLCEALADVFNVPLSYLYDDNQTSIPNKELTSGTPPDGSYVRVNYEDTKLLCENYEEMPESMRLPILKMVTEARKQLELLRQNERNDDNAEA